MAEVITAAIDQAWRATASASIAVVDSVGGTRTESIGTSGKYYRQVLVKSTADGSATNPYSYLFTVGAALGSAWELGPVTSGGVGTGFWYIKYLGTGTGTITWDGSGGTSTVPRNLLGFSTNVSLATNATLVATYHPAGFVYTIGRRNCKDYERRKPMAAYATTPDGRVYGWRDSSRQVCLAWDAIGHPRDWATRNSLPAACTPLYPTDPARILTPPSSVAAASPPWSVLDFWDTCAGFDLAYVRDFQAVLAGSVSTFDVLHLAEETIMADRPTAPMQANWSGRFNFSNMQFNVVAVAQSMS